MRLDSPGPVAVPPAPRRARHRSRSRSTSSARCTTASPHDRHRDVRARADRRRASASTRRRARIQDDRRRARDARRAARCGARASTSCPSCGTCCVARCRSSGRGRRSPTRSSTTHRTGSRALPSSPASPACGRSAAARTVTLEEMVALDVEYVARRSLWLNFRSWCDCAGGAEHEEEHHEDRSTISDGAAAGSLADHLLVALPWPARHELPGAGRRRRTAPSARQPDRLRERAARRPAERLAGRRRRRPHDPGLRHLDERQRRRNRVLQDQHARRAPTTSTSCGSATTAATARAWSPPTSNRPRRCPRNSRPA